MLILIYQKFNNLILQLMRTKYIIPILIFVNIGHAFSQKKFDFDNLGNFKNTGKNWEIVGDISGKYDLSKLNTLAGKGILHCQPHTEGVKSEDILTNFEHGDINISFDFMMPKESNSGIYFQGQYEVQLYDSWGVKTPKVHDCGAIYERWDPTRGKGNEGFEGHPPRQNVSFAPGLWQHMEISFLAPKFDNSGKKISNAKFVKVVQNGFLIHENIEMLAPTRGSLLPIEIAKGPIRLQGDHGEVVFKNFNYELLDKPLSILENVKYQYFEGKFDKIPATLPAKINSKGTLEKINYRIAEKNSDFLIAYNGDLVIPETDNYTFQLNATGICKLVVDGKVLFDQQEHHWRNEEFKKSIDLSQGNHKLELYYSRTFSWGGRALGLFIRRQGTPNQPLHDYISLPDPEPVGLIEVKANPSEPVLQRSFVYFNDKKRTHAINIAEPNGVNFSYDLERAAILNIWKGKFLDATDMWFERGEPQTSKPLSAFLQLNGKNPIFSKKGANNTIPDSLSVENEFVYKGYSFDSQRNPIFKYNFSNEIVTDKLSAIPDGSGLSRIFSFTNYLDNTYIRAGESKTIIDLGNGTYAMENHYIKVDPSLKSVITVANGLSILLIPVTSRNIAYAIIW